MRRLLFSSVLMLAIVLPLRAQQQGASSPPTPDSADTVAPLVARLKDILRSGDRASLAALTIPGGDDAVFQRFADDFIVPGVGRAVAVERDRLPLQGALPGDGYRLIVEFFAEVESRGLLMTARLDVRRAPGGGMDSWRIVDVERLSLVEGLFRLRLDTASPMTARNFRVEAEDFQLTLAEGTVFPVLSDAGTTGLVLLGRGDMRFAPPSETEKGQIRIFGGAETLTATFDAAYVRVNPEDYSQKVTLGTLQPVIADARTVRRAQEVFERESPKSFNLDLSDLSSDLWYIMPASGDFLAEVRTRRFGILTYARNANQAEDISVFDRGRRRTISIYPSAEKLASRGRHFNEDELTDFDVINYDVDTSIDPDRQVVRGRARLTVRSRSAYLSTLTLRLADALEVSNVTSPVFGRLLFLRVRHQNSILVNLPSAVGLNSEITLTVSYAGQIESQRADVEALTMALAFDAGQVVPEDSPGFIPERSYLLSNRAYWYPQNSVSDYATARLRVAVPEGWGVVASGERSFGSDTRLADLVGPIGTARATTFTAAEPVRYLSLVVSRFVRVADSTISARDVPAFATNLLPQQTSALTMSLVVEANPRQQGRGREVGQIAADVLRFYGTLMDDTPYPAMLIAVVENDLPGGHSPGYAAVLNNPPPASQPLWRNDPAAFVSYPEFFVAHELAHQWWGQAIGWKNYHEQWISEGFAQYFSALYAHKSRGESAFNDMIRQFRRWAMAESSQGPVYLGYRLGHVKNDTRVFRALVYNKGAGVLHMLRRMIGDDAFFRGLRRFYNDHRFQKAGTDDLELAMEAESGRTLDRFFEQWIYGSNLPRVRYSSTISGGEVIVTFEQLTEDLFDVPVTVTIHLASGAVSDVVVQVTDRRVERRIKVDGAVRRIQINRDSAALAAFVTS